MHEYVLGKWVSVILWSLPVSPDTHTDLTISTESILNTYVSLAPNSTLRTVKCLRIPAMHLDLPPELVQVLVERELAHVHSKRDETSTKGIIIVRLRP